MGHAGRIREGLAWFDAVLTDRPEPSVTPAVWVKAVTDHSVLANGVAAPGDPARRKKPWRSRGSSMTGL